MDFAKVLLSARLFIFRGNQRRQIFQTVDGSRHKPQETLEAVKRYPWRFVAVVSKDCADLSESFSNHCGKYSHSLFKRKTSPLYFALLVWRDAST